MQLKPGSEFVTELLRGIEVTGGVAHPIVFVVGSGLALPVDGYNGVPGTAEIVRRVRSSLSRHHRAELDRQIAGDPQGNHYQLAFESLSPDLADKLIVEVVLDALRDPKLRPAVDDSGGRENTVLTQLEMQPTIWSIRPGLLALGEIFARHREVVKPYVLTTNFDPLIKLALRHHGVDAEKLAAANDTYPGAPERDAMVVHLHGYWREVDTMHTGEALRHGRPKLKEWLKGDLLRAARVVVLGYGGWDDLLMDCLLEAVPIASQRKISIDWTFHGKYDAAACSRLVVKLSDLAGEHVNRRITFFENVHADTVLPELARSLDEHRGSRGSAGRLARPGGPEPARRGDRDDQAGTAPARAPGRRELCHEALAALATAQRVVALKNFRIAQGSPDDDASARQVGYGWRQELSPQGGHDRATQPGLEGAPSVLATAQSLAILAGLAAPPPLLAQLLVRPWLDQRARPNGGWSIEELQGRSLVRVTAFIVQTACRARFATSPRVLASAVGFLLQSQRPNGGWGYDETCAPEVISTAQTAAALAAMMRDARDALGDLVSVNGTVRPVEDALRDAITAAADFLIVRQSAGGSERGLVRSGFDPDLGKVPVRKVSSPLVARLVRTAEAALAFRAMSESPSIDANVRGRAAAALERAGAWLLRNCEHPGLETADYSEAWPRDARRTAEAGREPRAESWTEPNIAEKDTSWAHCSLAMTARGLLAAHVDPTTARVGELIRRIIATADGDGLWDHPSNPGVPLVFTTKDATCALRDYAAAVADLDPSVLLDGPRMAVVDASHYGLYRAGLFGVTVVRPPVGEHTKLVRHDLPFGLPSEDLKPADDRTSTLRTRLLVDTIVRSTIESLNVHLERHDRPIDAAIAILRGGLPFVAALGDTFVHVPFGLLAGTRRGSAADVRWLLPPTPSGSVSRVLLADLVANTGATLEAAVGCVVERFTAKTAIVIACGFAHKDAIQRLERLPAVEEIHVAHQVTTRDGAWLSGIGFDAGDLAMGIPPAR